MNPRYWPALLVGAAMLLAFPVVGSMVYTVSEQEMAVLLQFGRPVASQTAPGLYFKMPLVQEVLRLPKTLQVWHGTRQQDKLVDVPTRDGKKVEVTVWAVWRITDPAQFVRTLRTVSNAEERVKQFVRAAARDTITVTDLAEVVRSTDRRMTYTLGLPPEMLAKVGVAPDGVAAPAAAGTEELPDFVVPPEARQPVQIGRGKVMDEIKATAQQSLSEDSRAGATGSNQGRGRGIEVVDIGLSRIEFVPEVRQAAFRRATALMEAISAKAISEGEQRKQEIINRAQAEVQKIEGEGKQKSNTIRGKAEAQVIDAYAAAIREAGEFYTFTRTLDIFKESLGGDTRLILTTDGDLFRFLKGLPPEPGIGPGVEGSPEPPAATAGTPAFAPEAAAR